MKNFDEIFNLMQTSFPENEFRTFENQKNLLQNPHYKIITIKNENNNIIAFLAFWSFENFNFIEHLAVSPSCRGKGTGTKIVSDFMKENSLKSIILEIEPPVTEISIKRLKFYEKLGFKLNNYEYFQLPLRENHSPLKLNLMSYPEKLTPTEFENIKNKIYSEVYKADSSNVDIM